MFTYLMNRYKIVYTILTDKLVSKHSLATLVVEYFIMFFMFWKKLLKILHRVTIRHE